MRLVLASASPRRADLLRAAGFDFDVDPADTDETTWPGEEPVPYATRVARAKADIVSGRQPGAWVVAADTIVVVGGEILGKPRDEADAARMLRLLSGREHDVVTGVAVRHGQEERSVVETTAVRFGPLDPVDIAWYVASGEPLGKAGAYAIQGLASRFVTGISGSYSNVVGLPVARVCGMLRDLSFTGRVVHTPGD